MFKTYFGILIRHRNLKKTSRQKEAKKKIGRLGVPGSKVGASRQTGLAGVWANRAERRFIC